MRRRRIAAVIVLVGFVTIAATIPVKDVQLTLVLALAVLAAAFLFSGLIDLALPPEGARHRHRRSTEPRLIAGYRIGARRHGRSH